ncbi:Cochaperone protein [Cryptotrichosporon argae]
MSAIPRHDHYQTPSHLIVSLYAKGLDARAADVRVVFERQQVTVTLPAIPGAETATIVFPLAGPIAADESTYRVLSTKVELRLQKATPSQWSTLLSSAPTISTQPVSSAASASTSVAGAASPASSAAAPPAAASPASAPAPASASASAPGPPRAQAAPALAAGPSTAKRAARKNWDKIVDADDEPADPNAGGDAALQKFFSQLYADGDADTRRAMIKSYTESGGTSLSVDWAQVGKEKMEVRPPDGMEARKY